MKKRHIQKLHSQKKNGNDIIKMYYVGPFIVLMMGKMLNGEVYKSWDAFIVTLILWTILIPTLNIEKCLITYYTTYGITSLKKYLDAIFVVVVIVF